WPAVLVEHPPDRAGLRPRHRARRLDHRAAVTRRHPLAARILQPEPSSSLRVFRVVLLHTRHWDMIVSNASHTFCPSFCSAYILASSACIEIEFRALLMACNASL